MANASPELPRLRLDDMDVLCAVWNAVAVGLVLSDAEGKVLAVNQAYCSLYGSTPDEFVGHSFAVIFPMEVREEAEREYRAVFERGEPMVVESSVRSSAGEELLVEARASFIEHHGRRVGMLSTIRDVTAQRRAEAERERFMTSASHDLLQPLALIKGRAQLLLRRLRRGKVATEGLQTNFQAIATAVDDVVDQLAALVDNARRRAGQPLLLQRGPVELTTLVGDVVAAHQASSDTCDVQFDATPLPLVGQFDETRLRRVVSNLLSNAVKYSPGGGEIRVRLRTESSAEATQAIVEVEDQGVGIPAADLPHVFEQYHRGANVAEQVAGTGLGLAGAREIVEQHGGSLEVESQEGQGSLFRVRLPVS